MKGKIGSYLGLLILMTAIILTLPSQASAKNLSIGPQIGYFRSQDADNGSVMGGLELRFKVNQYFGGEASINYRQEKYADGLLTVRSWPVMLTGLLYPVPFIYGAMGAGWYNTTLDYDQDRLPLLKDDTAQKIGWHFGGGLELPLSPKIRLTTDFRYVFLDYQFEEIPGSEDMKSNFYVISAGLLYDLISPKDADESQKK